ncbi:MAG: hypothetical protein J0M12_10260 [Deltaproteobacteria bacterium]|nr:hypothetical protein [Deltaproteobacteria bacterium]
MMKKAEIWGLYCKQISRSKAFKTLVPLVLLGAGAILAQRLSMYSLAATSLRKHSWELVGILSLEAGYLAVKSFAWKLSYNSAGIPLSWFASLRLFLISCFIDTISFPTVVAGDGFKLVYLRSYGATRVLQAIVELRAGALLGYCVVAGLLLSWGLQSIALLLVATLALPPLILKILSRQRQVISWTTYFRVLRQALLNSLALAVDGGRFLILGSVVGLTPSLYALGSYIVSQLGGLITGIPLGLGAREAVLTALLQQSLPLAQIAFILLALRLTGEGIAATAGWLLAGKEVMEWRKENPRN